VSKGLNQSRSRDPRAGQYDVYSQFGYNIGDLQHVIKSKFVRSGSNWRGEISNGNARITMFKLKRNSALVQVEGRGANKKILLNEVRRLTQFMQLNYDKGKAKLLKEINFNKKIYEDEYKRIKRELKRTLTFEKEFGYTSELVNRRINYEAKEIEMRYKIHDINIALSDKYIEDFKILNVYITDNPKRYFNKNILMLIYLSIAFVCSIAALIIISVFRMKSLPPSLVHITGVEEKEASR